MEMLSYDLYLFVGRQSKKYLYFYLKKVKNFRFLKLLIEKNKD